MDNEERLNQIEQEIRQLKDYKSQKDTQQISLPLDDASQRIIEDVLPATVAPDYTGLSRFGGDGSDGALTISSGTTTIDVASAPIFVKNYTTLSIAGSTSNLAFSSPPGSGTIVILKVQGDVTITSSNTPAISVNSMGGVAGGAAGAPSQGVVGGNGYGIPLGTTGGGAGNNDTGGGAGAAGISPFDSKVINAVYKSYAAACGSGGGSGGASGGPLNKGGGGAGGASIIANGTAGTVSTGGGGANGNSGAGGRGAGAIIIECGGALNITGTINAVGGDATAPTGTGSNGGGGGGGGGTIIILYKTLTANSGTFNVNGGAKTNASVGGGNGGAGGAGTSLVAQYKA